MQLKDLIKKSRSYRRFHQDFEITEIILKELVDLARCSPSAANNQPLKYILSYDPIKNSKIFPTLAWAAYLKDWDGPIDGERPSAYIIILSDNEISRSIKWDHGICAQSILLGAAEKELGGCMIASIDKSALAKSLNIPKRYEIQLVIALGKPDEIIKVDDITGSSIKYYRDNNDVHHVPKRSLEDIILDL